MLSGEIETAKCERKEAKLRAIYWFFDKYLAIRSFQSLSKWRAINFQFFFSGLFEFTWIAEGSRIEQHREGENSENIAFKLKTNNLIMENWLRKKNCIDNCTNEKTQKKVFPIAKTPRVRSHEVELAYETSKKIFLRSSIWRLIRLNEHSFMPWKLHSLFRCYICLFPIYWTFI